VPSYSPSWNPTIVPSHKPTEVPTVSPTLPGETNQPSCAPSLAPTFEGATNTPTRIANAADIALCSLISSTNIPSLVEDGVLSGWKCGDNFVPESPSGSAAAYCDDGWTGVTCIDNVIDAIDLSGFGIVGSVPFTVGNLVSLRSLDMSANEFIGPLPTSLSRLVNLESLDVHDNFLGSASISSDGDVARSRRLQNIDDSLHIFGNMESLSYLDISGNGFQGEIPGSLCAAPLRTLRVKELESTSYPRNEFTCISSCLLANPNLILVIPSNIQECVTTEPTSSPTNPAAGALTNSEASPQSTTSVIGYAVGGFVFIGLVIVLCLFFRKRVKEQQDLKEEAFSNWQEKEKTRLDIHELQSASSSNNTSDSNNSISYSSHSSYSGSGSSTGSGSRASGSTGMKKMVGNGLELRTQNSADLSFPLVVDLDTSDGENDKFTVEHSDDLYDDGSSYVTGSTETSSVYTRSLDSQTSRTTSTRSNRSWTSGSLGQSDSRSITSGTSYSGSSVSGSSFTGSTWSRSTGTWSTRSGMSRSTMSRSSGFFSSGVDSHIPPIREEREESSYTNSHSDTERGDSITTSTYPEDYVEYGRDVYHDDSSLRFEEKRDESHLFDSFDDFYSTSFGGSEMDSTVEGTADYDGTTVALSVAESASAPGNVRTSRGTPPPRSESDSFALNGTQKSQRSVADTSESSFPSQVVYRGQRNQPEASNEDSASSNLFDVFTSPMRRPDDDVHVVSEEFGL